MTLNPERDHGVERSSASWERWENFLTTSAMVRFMATLEQFELDALKALMYYRPEGMVARVQGLPPIEAQEEVVHERPIERDQVWYYERPAIWTWMRRSAENNTERRQIFSRVFGIKFPQPTFGRRHQDLCELRNMIAHGREAVLITVNDLLQIHGYVTSTIIEIRDRVLEKYQVAL